MALFATLVPVVQSDKLANININKATFVLGRLPTCDHVFSDLRSSSRHSIINYNASNKSFILQDNATNGTYLNDKKIGKGKKVPMKHNDVIAFVRGRLEFKFSINNNNNINNDSLLSLDPLADTMMNKTYKNNNNASLSSPSNKINTMNDTVFSLDPFSDNNSNSSNSPIKAKPNRKRKQSLLGHDAVKSEPLSPPKKKRKLSILDDDIEPLMPLDAFELFDIDDADNIHNKKKEEMKNNANKKKNTNNKKKKENDNVVKKLKISNPRNMRAADIRNLDIETRSDLFDGFIALLIAKKSKRLDILMQKFIENAGQIFDENDQKNDDDIYDLLKNINVIIMSDTTPYIKLKKKLCLSSTNASSSLEKFHIVTLDWISQSILHKKLLSTKKFVPKCLKNNNQINIKNINKISSPSKHTMEEFDGNGVNEQELKERNEDEEKQIIEHNVIDNINHDEESNNIIIQQIEDRLLIVKHKSWKASTKIAAFDLDGTLITTNSGNKFPKNYKDWRFLYDFNFVQKKKIKQYYDENYSFVMFSNQKLSHLKAKKINKYHEKLKALKLKIPSIMKQIYISIGRQNKIVPFVFIAALNDDIHRKPCRGMFDYFNENINLYKENEINGESFYVGDAAGRVKGWKNGRAGNADFSCSDRKFAANCNLTFYTPEEFWLNGTKCTKYQWLNLKEIMKNNKNTKYPSQLTEINNNKQEMIMFIGYPGSGKTTIYKRFFYGHNYKWINRDTLKTMEKCQIECKKYLDLKYSVVVDNTNPSKNARKKFIQIAKKYNIKIRCVWIQTDKQISHHLNVMRWRMSLNKNEQIKKIPILAYKKFIKEFQQPQLMEGFESIIKVPFIPSFDNDELKTQFLLQT